MVPGPLTVAVVPEEVVEPIVAVPVVWLQALNADPVTFTPGIGSTVPTKYQVDPDGLVEPDPTVVNVTYTTLAKTVARVRLVGGGEAEGGTRGLPLRSRHAVVVGVRAAAIASVVRP